MAIYSNDARQRINKVVKYVESNILDNRVQPGQVYSHGETVYWGKLDAALAYNGTATVSIWSDDWTSDTGDNITDVDAPPTMTSGTITSGSFVRIRQRPDGVWYVDMAPC